MDLDFQKLGFKAGIEIHQELDTGKLFCSCSSALSEKERCCTAIRKIRASAGESGKIDMASAYEQVRDRSFIYQGYIGEACLVELDEEPPHPVNPDALRIALGTAKLIGLTVPETICVMRKTVTDGSAVSGFQRTMLVGIEGKDSFISLPEGKVKICQLNLEEDSCKIEKKEDNKVHYSLSRLGIPLLEIGTDASLKSPAHVKSAALEIGTLLRSFKVKRGLGTIRQDVNISISGGERIEVKGWQDLKRIEELVKNEVMRQHSLLQIKKELDNRGIKKIEKRVFDATSDFRGCESKIIKAGIEKGGSVYAIVLWGFSGLLKREICPGKTFGKELSEYAKAYGTKGMIHTDEDLSKYKLEKEFAAIRKKVKAGEKDLIIIISEENEIAKKAADAVYERAEYCLTGVPKETRIPNHADATSSYARPLPGAHRLYPETDIPNIEVTKDLLDSIVLPELIKEKIDRFKKDYGIDSQQAKELIREGYDFEGYAKKHKSIEPRLIATYLVEFPKEIKKRYGKEIDPETNAEDIFSRLEKKEISKDAAFEILAEYAQGKEVDYSKYKTMPENELVEIIRKIVLENKGLPANAMIGKVMEKLRGKADGKKIVEIVNKFFGKN